MIGLVVTVLGRVDGGVLVTVPPWRMLIWRMMMMMMMMFGGWDGGSGV